MMMVCVCAMAYIGVTARLHWNVADARRDLRAIRLCDVVVIWQEEVAPATLGTFFFAGHGMPSACTPFAICGADTAARRELLRRLAMIGLRVLPWLQLRLGAAAGDR